MLPHLFMKIVFSLAFFAYIIFDTTKLFSFANHAVVPLKIEVSGKLVITDAENDTKAGENPTLNVLLGLTPDLNNNIVSGMSSIRIRTNMKTWKLTASRIEQNELGTEISPQDVNVKFITQAGSKGNLNSAKLVSPFNEITTLDKISTNTPIEILNGFDKTSLAKDPENKNNWFQLTAIYSVSPDFFYDIGNWDTTITYNLVSP